MQEPEIDLDKAKRGLGAMERSNPRFKAVGEKLRKAAKTVMRGALLLLFALFAKR